MAYIPVKKREDIGLSPYELKFRGQKKSDKVFMTVFDIKPDEVTEKEIRSVKELKTFKNSGSITWLNIDGLHNEKLMAEVAEELNISGDILSDVLEPSARPQVEEFNEGVFVSIKIMEADEKKNRVSENNFSLILMKNLLITFQENRSDVFDPVRERIRKHKTKIRTSGTDYLAFALLDVVIDHYIYIMGIYGEKIETLEARIMQGPDKGMLGVINLYKHELSNLRRNIKPANEMIMNLAKLDTDFIREENKTHYKELQDNIHQAVELLDYCRELLYDELNIYHSFMSTRLNDIMTVLTIFSVVFIPLTFIVGVYGMNFENMPELHWKNGYYVVWGAMVAVALGMLWYFKKQKWF